MKLTKIIYILTGVFVTFFAKPAKSQELLTLEEAIRIGLENNYAIRIARQDEVIAENNVKYGRGFLLPDVNLSASRDWSTEDSRRDFQDRESTDVSGARSAAFGSAVNLNWTIFDGFGMFIDYDRLKTAKLGQELVTKTTVENTVAQITNTYYEVVRQRQKIRSLQEALAISEERVNITQAQYEVGVTAKVEILTARVDYNADKSALLLQQEALHNAKINLNEILARSPEINFTVADTILVDKTISPAAENVSIAQNPVLLQAQVNRELAQLEYRSIRADRLPTLGVNTSYVYNTSTADPTSPFAPIAFRTRGLYYGLTLNWPILNGFTLRRQWQNAKVNMSKTDLAYQQLQNQLNADAARALSRYQNRILLLQLEEDNLKLADQNTEIALERYRLGLLTAIELREAQRSQLLAENRFIDILYEAKAAETELRRLNSTIVLDN
ncbi:MAG: TolC family protein [Hymenobacteraceae bacterium]|nr:TolC family protein [Hymenobacteraceae bacterium]MDX5394833.1 TolC family protein [Hymenobacteraceae bacterium]MDX5510867.1 TolC family protein [Hymenobacteraceae bacterium]